MLKINTKGINTDKELKEELDRREELLKTFQTNNQFKCIINEFEVTFEFKYVNINGDRVFRGFYYDSDKKIEESYPTIPNSVDELTKVLMYFIKKDEIYLYKERISEEKKIKEIYSKYLEIWNSRSNGNQLLLLFNSRGKYKLIKDISDISLEMIDLSYDGYNYQPGIFDNYLWVIPGDKIYRNVINTDYVEEYGQVDVFLLYDFTIEEPKPLLGIE